MDNLLSHPNFVPFVLSVIGSLTAAIVFALAVKSWTRLRHLPQHLTNRLLTLAKEFDPPTLVRKSKLNTLIAACTERDALQTLLDEQKQHNRELSDELHKCEATLQIADDLVFNLGDTQSKTNKALDSFRAENNHLRKQNNQLKEGCA